MKVSEGNLAIREDLPLIRTLNFSVPEWQSGLLLLNDDFLLLQIRPFPSILYLATYHDLRRTYTPTIVWSLWRWSIKMKKKTTTTIFVFSILHEAISSWRFRVKYVVPFLERYLIHRIVYVLSIFIRICSLYSQYYFTNFGLLWMINHAEFYKGSLFKFIRFFLKPLTNFFLKLWMTNYLIFSFTSVFDPAITSRPTLIKCWWR